VSRRLQRAVADFSALSSRRFSRSSKAEAERIAAAKAERDKEETSQPVTEYLFEGLERQASPAGPGPGKAAGRKAGFRCSTWTNRDWLITPIYRVDTSRSAPESTGTLTTNLTVGTTPHPKLREKAPTP
jgi:hypothetical protein